MADRKNKVRSVNCMYAQCNARSRDNIPGLRFYSLPTGTDPSNILQWLVNSGIGHLAEATDKELQRVRICSGHFPQNAILPSGRLRRDAVPKLFEPPQLIRREPPSVPGADTGNEKKWAKNKRDLEEQIRIRDAEIMTLKERNTALRRSLKNAKLSLSRQNAKIRAGVLPDESLAKALFRRVQGFLYTFMMMQLFRKDRTPYSKDEKEMAMTMHYISPSLYTKLRDDFGFVLPSAAILKLWFGHINLWPGICSTIFECLKEKVSHMSASERNCVLIFDEIKIKKGFEYNESRQKVEGFEDLGTLGSTDGVATSALVFMARGLLFNWKQPVGYFLTASTVAHEKLTQLTNQMLGALIDIGLKVRGIICDQGTNNQSSMGKRVTMERPYFTFRGQKIFAIFDVPHIFKNFRNQLLNHNITFDDGRTASWDDVRALHNLEKNEGTRAAVKLSSKHVFPGIFQKMNCRLALQVFSNRVAAALFTAGTTNCIESSTVMDTAEFFTDLNDVFDNLNSRCANDPNPNRCALSLKRPGIQKNLENVLERSAEWRTLTKNGPKVPPCFSGFRQTITAILMLWEDLKREDVLFLMTSRLNQDPLENLFSTIRYRGGTYNQNPTACEFRLTFQKKIVLNLMKPAQSANCLDDEDESLLDTDVQVAANNRSRKVADEVTTNASTTDCDVRGGDGDNDSDDETHLVDIDKIIAEIDEANAIAAAKLHSSAVEYFAGYIAKKAIDTTSCARCQEALVDPEPQFGDRNILTYFRTYATVEGTDFGHMYVATSEFSYIFDVMNATFDASYPQVRAEYGIQDKLYPELKRAVHRTNDGWFDDEMCGEHRRKLAYNFMRIKINKDVKWLGEKLRFQTNRKYNSKPPQKLRNLQST